MRPLFFLVLFTLVLFTASGCQSDDAADRAARDATPTDTARAASPAPDTQGVAATGSADAVEVIRAYYAAIEAEEYQQAYGYWGGDGAASGQTFEEFRSGFVETASVGVKTGDPGRIEPAAGSRYIEVPVSIRAVTSDGETQRFRGTYVLRRAVVTGASAEQRQWHLYSADITQVE